MKPLKVTPVPATKEVSKYVDKIKALSAEHKTTLAFLVNAYGTGVLADANTVPYFDLYALIQYTKRGIRQTGNTHYKELLTMLRNIRNYTKETTPVPAVTVNYKFITTPLSKKSYINIVNKDGVKSTIELYRVLYLNEQPDGSFDIEYSTQHDGMLIADQENIIDFTISLY
jgi:hypothetical protein